MVRLLTLLLIFLPVTPLYAETPSERRTLVGVPTLLSGDWSELGQNIVNTTRTYERHYLRHPIAFEFEDAKISGSDGLKAYQKLINISHVDMLIGATSSNGTMAGASLINSSKTLMITPVTGGSNIDNAGEWIFRLGNSDVMNGIQQAQIFKSRGLKTVALLSEETEYTQDIARSFTESLRGLGVSLAWSGSFPPGSTDFRSQLSVALKSKPQALFIPTQTGSALALILTQLSQLGGFAGEIHTTFTAADNPDANALARGRFKGLYYLAPAYGKDSPRLKEFLVLYREEHHRDPLITFHTAATVDALDLLQLFLDEHKTYNGEDFKEFLSKIKDYSGLLGTFSIDEKGNADTGFVPAKIQ